MKTKIEKPRPPYKVTMRIDASRAPSGAPMAGITTTAQLEPNVEYAHLLCALSVNAVPESYRDATVRALAKILKRWFKDSPKHLVELAGLLTNAKPTDVFRGQE